MIKKKKEKKRNLSLFLPNTTVLYWTPLTFIVWTKAVFKISSFMFHRRKKVIQVWNDVSE